MQISIGFSTADDALKNVLELADQIKPASVQFGPNDLLLAFCNSGISRTDFFQNLRRTFGEIPVIGGGVIGVITNQDYEYRKPAAGAMLIQGHDYTYRYGSTQIIDKKEVTSGENLISNILVESIDKAALLFFESTKIEPTETSPPIFYEPTLFCNGIYKKMPENILMAGGGLIDSHNFTKTWQFCGDSVQRDAAVALMLGGPVKPYCKIFHGCTPLDGIYHTITKMTEGIVEELDNEPIVEMIDKLHQDKNWRHERPLKFLTLGINKGDKFSDFVETSYISRLISGITPDEKGIMLMEPSFKEGDEIQFMLRDNNKMVETAKEGTQSLINTIEAENKKPCFAFYIDCAGRASNFCNSLTEEAEEVQKLMNKYNIPLLGIYSGIEIAPFDNRSMGLDWTGVLFVLTKD